MMKSKRCIKCNDKKTLDKFTKYSRSKDGHTALCKECRSIKRTRARLENLEASLEKERCYRKNNREKMRRGNKKWREKNEDYYSKYAEQNKAQIAKKQKEWREFNRQHLKKYRAKYRENNRKQLAEKSLKKYHKNKTNIQTRLATNLRARLRGAIKHNQKTGSAVKDLGCSIEELKQHLEAQFKPGMTWENYGRGGWHIDHIKPLSSFDLTDRKQLKQACHYTNLQPLWEEENLRKGSKDE